MKYTGHLSFSDCCKIVKDVKEGRISIDFQDNPKFEEGLGSATEAIELREEMKKAERTTIKAFEELRKQLEKPLKEKKERIKKEVENVSLEVRKLIADFREQKFRKADKIFKRQYDALAILKLLRKEAEQNEETELKKLAQRILTGIEEEKSIISAYNETVEELEKICSLFGGHKWIPNGDDTGSEPTPAHCACCGAHTHDYREARLAIHDRLYDYETYAQRTHCEYV